MDIQLKEKLREMSMGNSESPEGNSEKKLCERSISWSLGKMAEETGHELKQQRER